MWSRGSQIFSEITCGLSQCRYSIRNISWKCMCVLFIDNSQYSNLNVSSRTGRITLGFMSPIGLDLSPWEGYPTLWGWGGCVPIHTEVFGYPCFDRHRRYSGTFYVLKAMWYVIWKKVFNYLKCQKIYYERVFWTRMFDR